MEFLRKLSGMYESYAIRDKTEFIVRPEKILNFSKKLKEIGFNFLVDLFGVDFKGDGGEDIKKIGRIPEEARFAVIYHWLKIPENERIRVIVPLTEEQKIPSITGLIKSANWFERETYDMFGIKFEGHPDMRRILMPEDFEDFPLRKDFPIKGKKEYIGTKFTPNFVRIEKSVSDSDEDPFEEGSKTVINIGPSHPATHGVLRIVAEIQGETIVGADVEIGYLHRGVEKSAEYIPYEHFIPMTDRLNYVSSYLNNMIYTEAIERMSGIDPPERAKYIRVILGELMRIADHLVCIGTNIVDLGAFTPFLYLFEVREEIYSLLEYAVGARLTTSGTNFGGVPRDFDEKMKERTYHIVDRLLPKAIKDVDRMMTKNKIFIDRTRGIGKVTAQDAIEWGFTGPCLRASGVAWDLRKVSPYSVYNNFDFEIPVATEGDVYSRYLVRMEEMIQSAKIIRQAVRNIPDGDFILPEFKKTIPPKEKVYKHIEPLIHHFKVISESGVKPKPDWAYFAGEAANGELGFFIIPGEDRYPFRLRIRSPCFAIYQAFRHMILGQKIADAIATLGSINIVAGELER